MKKLFKVMGKIAKVMEILVVIICVPILIFVACDIMINNPEEAINNIKNYKENRTIVEIDTSKDSEAVMNNNTSTEVDTPIRLDNNKSTIAEEERRPEPVVPNEVIGGEVYVTQQMNSDGIGYYVMNEVRYIDLGIVTPDMSASPGSVIGLVIADGSIGEMGCYSVILENTGDIMDIKSLNGFINTVPIYKFSTQDKLDQYGKYIHDTSDGVLIEDDEEEFIDHSNNGANVQSYEMGEVIEVARGMFHIIYDDVYDGYREITFGIGDTGPYNSTIFYEDGEYIPDFNNMEVIKLKVVDTESFSVYEGEVVNTIEFDFIQ